MKNVLVGAILFTVFLTLDAAGGRKPAAVRGEVICLTCYLKDGREASGPDHRACAEACYRQGLPLAILQEETGDLFLPVTTGMSKRGTDQERFVCSLVEHTPVRSKLNQYFGETVEVTGDAFPGNGVTLLTVEAVEHQIQE
ncbi:MAG: hypothetical protein ACE5HZ_03975 [Fidelibacterota bacterium]